MQEPPECFLGPSSKDNNYQPEKSAVISMGSWLLGFVKTCVNCSLISLFACSCPSYAYKLGPTTMQHNPVQDTIPSNNQVICKDSLN